MSLSVLIRTRAVSDVEVAGSRVKTSVSLWRATCRGGHVEAVFFSPSILLIMLESVNILPIMLESVNILPVMALLLNASAHLKC